MTSTQDQIILNRVQEVYERLVDETGIPTTYGDRKKNELLHHSLELLEYIVGNEDDNPLVDWFEDEWCNNKDCDPIDSRGCNKCIGS